MIRVEALSVRFGRTLALDSVDLVLGDGVTGLFGPNGSGKSTLLRALAGLLRPTTGRLTLDGRALSTAEEGFRSQVGYAGHDSGLYPTLTVGENLELFGRLYGTPRQRPAEMMERLELTPTMPVAELSSGFKRRAAVARALLHEPRLVLLDEPYANLDDDAQSLVTEALLAWRSPGRAAVIATHGAKRVKAFADAGVILRRGRVVTYGRYRRPRAVPGRRRESARS